MPEAIALSELLVGLNHAAGTGHDLTAVLERVTDNVSNLLGVRGAAVSLAAGRSVRHLACNYASLTALSDTEERAQQGPTVDAVVSGMPVMLGSLGALSVPWPDYAARAASVGIGAVAAVPVDEPEPLVALTLAHDGAHEWSANDVAVARMFAVTAALFVRCGSEIAKQRRTVEQLQAALESRVLIEQAKGFVADQRKITVDAAFMVLRKYANDHHVTLRSVAEAVVHLGLRP